MCNNSHSIFLRMESDRANIPHMLRDDYIPIFVVKSLLKNLVTDDVDSSKLNLCNKSKGVFRMFAQYDEEDESMWTDDTLLEDNADFEGLFLLSDDDLNFVGSILRFAKDAIECFKLDKRKLGRYFIDEFEYPCLELLYLMDTMYGLLELSAYMIWMKELSQIMYFKKQFLSFCFSSVTFSYGNRERSNRILEHFLRQIILTHYCNAADKPELENAKMCAGDILKQITLKLISGENSPTNLDNEKNVLAMLKSVCIPKSVRKKYFSENLGIIANSGKRPFRSGTEILKCQEQFANPTKMLDKERFNHTVSQMIWSTLSSKDVFEKISNIILTKDFNWEMLLNLISVWLQEESSHAIQLLKSLIKTQIREGLVQNNAANVETGFILARHCCLVSSAAFSRYEKWFINTFESSSYSPANDYETFTFLTKTLTTWVSNEPSCFLHVHVTFWPFIPKGCREIWSDYLSLAKTRIAEYKEVEEAMEYEPNPNDPVQYEVEMVIKGFEISGKLPQSIHKMWIFKKQYYLNDFLPVLLRKPIGIPLTDARLRLIELLRRDGKVPDEMYNKYKTTTRV